MPLAVPVKPAAAGSPLALASAGPDATGRHLAQPERINKIVRYHCSNPGSHNVVRARGLYPTSQGALRLTPRQPVGYPMDQQSCELYLPARVRRLSSCAPTPPPTLATSCGRIDLGRCCCCCACLLPPTGSAAPPATSRCRTGPPRRSRGATRRYPLATRRGGLLLLLLRRTRTGLPPTRRRRCSCRGRGRSGSGNAASCGPPRRLGGPRSLGCGGRRRHGRRSVV